MHNELQIDEVNAAMLCEWWNNGMVFHQAPLEEVMQTLANWYNVPIAITNTKWRSEKVTIRIKTRTFLRRSRCYRKRLAFITSGKTIRSLFINQTNTKTIRCNQPTTDSKKNGLRKQTGHGALRYLTTGRSLLKSTVL